LERLLKEAQTHTRDRDVVQQSLTQLLDRAYGKAGLRLAFSECNQPDSQILGAALSSAVECPLKGMLLDEFLFTAPETAQRFDLVVTTFNHLSEVTKAVGADAKAKVIGVQSLVTHDTLLQLARLPAAVIGFVYELPRVGDEFSHSIRTYQPNATVMPVSINAQTQLRMLLKRADAVVVTQLCQARFRALKPKLPVVLLATTIDQQSIGFLRSKLSEKESHDY
jgi:GntR family transcriptional regulator